MFLLLNLLQAGMCAAFVDRTSLATPALMTQPPKPITLFFPEFFDFLGIGKFSGNSCNFSGFPENCHLTHFSHYSLKIKAKFNKSGSYKITY